MIDLTNKPEGATHYSIGVCSGIQYMKDVGVDSYLWWHRGLWIAGDGKDHLLRCKPIASEWSIYNNDKPLSELSDEQRGLLFNHWVSDRYSVECSDCKGARWWTPKAVTWLDDCLYRAKQKSERELFIEATKKSASLRSRDGADTVYGELFDSGRFELKAPKVGE